jgi:uncharacterized membrane protein YfbV (UPF0208 family)
MVDIEKMSICDILYYLLKRSNTELHNRIEPIYNDMCRRVVEKQEKLPEKLPEPPNPYLIDDSELFH